MRYYRVLLHSDLCTRCLALDKSVLEASPKEIGNVMFGIEITVELGGLHVSILMDIHSHADDSSGTLIQIYGCSRAEAGVLRFGPGLGP